MNPSPNANGVGGEGARSAAYHAFDDLLWLFMIQHRHIQAEAARRLEERVARQKEVRFAAHTHTHTHTHTQAQKHTGLLCLTALGYQGH